jgi:hypothetical protein
MCGVPRFSVCAHTRWCPSPSRAGVPNLWRLRGPWLCGGLALVSEAGPGGGRGRAPGRARGAVSSQLSLSLSVCLERSRSGCGLHGYRIPRARLSTLERIGRIARFDFPYRKLTLSAQLNKPSLPEAGAKEELHLLLGQLQIVITALRT